MFLAILWLKSPCIWWHKIQTDLSTLYMVAANIASIVALAFGTILSTDLSASQVPGSQDIPDLSEDHSSWIYVGRLAYITNICHHI